MVAGRRKEDCVFRLPALYTGVYFMNQEKKTEKSDLLFLVLITILAVGGPHLCGGGLECLLE